MQKNSISLGALVAEDSGRREIEGWDVTSQNFSSTLVEDSPKHGSTSLLSFPFPILSSPPWTFHMAARVPSCLPQTQDWSWFSLESYSLQAELRSNLSQDPPYTVLYFPLHPYLSLSFSLDLKLEPHCTSFLFLKHCCYSMALWLCMAWPLQLDCLSVISLPWLCQDLVSDVPTAVFTYKPLSWIMLCFAVYLCPFLSFLLDWELLKSRSSCLLFMYFCHGAWQLIIWANVFQVPALYLTRQIISLIPFKNSLREVFFKQFSRGKNSLFNKYFWEN